MNKDFDKWNKTQIVLNGIEKVPYFREGEIWICFLGLNIGFEQDGKGNNFERPVVIVKKFNNEVCLIIPLSTTDRRGEYYFVFMFDLNTTSVAILSQIRFIDGRRLDHKIGQMKKEDFINMIEKLKALLP